MQIIAQNVKHNGIHPQAWLLDLYGSSISTSGVLNVVLKMKHWIYLPGFLASNDAHYIRTCRAMAFIFTVTLSTMMANGRITSTVGMARCTMTTTPCTRGSGLLEKGTAEVSTG